MSVRGESEKWAGRTDWQDRRVMILSFAGSGCVDPSRLTLMVVQRGAGSARGVGKLVRRVEGMVLDRVGQSAYRTKSSTVADKTGWTVDRVGRHRHTSTAILLSVWSTTLSCSNPIPANQPSHTCLRRTPVVNHTPRRPESTMSLSDNKSSLGHAAQQQQPPHPAGKV